MVMMKKSRFTETKIVKAVKEHEAGEKAKVILTNEGVQSKDRSDLYKEYKDLNEYPEIFT